MVLDIDQVVNAFQSTAEAMNQGVSTMDQAHRSLGDITGHIQTTLGKVREVVQLSAEQERAINDLKAMIHEVAALAEQSSAATQSSAAGSEEITASVENVASSAQTLSSLAKELEESVKKFKL